MEPINEVLGEVVADLAALESGAGRDGRARQLSLIAHLIVPPDSALDRFIATGD